MSANLIDVVRNFDIAFSPSDVSGLGEGMINNTYKVQFEGTGNEYVLQQINHQVFKNIDLLQNNIRTITDHIRKKLIEKGENEPERKTLTLIPTKDGKLYHYDGESYWRMTLLIPRAATYQSVTPENAYFAGQAFGNFQAMLADISHLLGETIPDFHNMEFRLSQFRDAVAENKAGRLDKVRDLVVEIEKRADEMCKCERLFRDGKIQKRINHCDTKVNNMLFDENGKVLCVIDLDTAMPGLVVSDFGDFMRSAGNSGKEDDTNLEAVKFNMDIFKSYTRGYLEQAKAFLTPLEIDLLPFGALLITYMQVTRFLADYLNGDTYYKINHPEHNIERTKAQWTLLMDMESKYPAMQDYINTLINKK